MKIYHKATHIQMLQQPAKQSHNTQNMTHPPEPNWEEEMQELASTSVFVTVLCCTRTPSSRPRKDRISAASFVLQSG